MKAKFFVMASVIALPGAVAAIAMQGCSSDNSETTPSTVDASEAAPTKQPAKDSAPEEQPDTGPETCPGTTPILEKDLPLKWAAPPAIQDNACTQQNIDDLKAAFAKSTTGGVKFADIKTTLGATCSACVFSPLKDDAGTNSANWSIFVETGSGAVDNRTGVCFARLKNEACGKARYNFESCLRTGCPAADCGSDANVKDCKNKIQSGACKEITDVYVAACPEETDLIAACNLYASIALSCSGGTDAGIDSSVP